jgi:hypothetical protein
MYEYAVEKVGWPQLESTITSRASDGWRLITTLATPYTGDDGNILWLMIFEKAAVSG